MNSEVTYLLVEPRCFILIVYNPGHSSKVNGLFLVQKSS